MRIRTADLLITNLRFGIFTINDESLYMLTKQGLRCSLTLMKDD